VAAARAARLLEEVCRGAPGVCGPGSPRFAVTADLSGEVAGLLGALDEEGGVGSADRLAEAALLAADVASLAACVLPDVPEESVHRLSAAVHLAAGSARSLGALCEEEARSLEGEHAGNVLRDARGAAWKSAFAVRQAESFFEGRG
jgi:hypothetical protein